jgi:hypothetical protein
MQAYRFRTRLAAEWETRRKSNPLFSGRAFAAFLGTDHSTLSQVLRGKRRAPAKQIRLWARKLGWTNEEAAVYVAAEYLPEPSSMAREAQVRHWTAEALAIVLDRVHWDVLSLCNAPHFRTDARWIAEQIGATVDQVNVAVSRLVRLELLEMSSAETWTDRANTVAMSEQDFRKLALVRVREKAAEAHVDLPQGGAGWRPTLSR